VCSWVFAQSALCCPRKAQIEQVIGVQVRELAAVDAPRGLTGFAETRAALLSAWQRPHCE
jgi:hypothetical protein